MGPSLPREPSLFVVARTLTPLPWELSLQFRGGADQLLDGFLGSCAADASRRGEACRLGMLPWLRAHAALGGCSQWRTSSTDLMLTLFGRVLLAGRAERPSCGPVPQCGHFLQTKRSGASSLFRPAAPSLRHLRDMARGA